MNTFERKSGELTLSLSSKCWQRGDDMLKKSGLSTGKVDVFYYKGMPDLTLVPPIRQTASIFKQPVTIYRTQDVVVKNDLKHGTQEKPKQLFWEKRLQGLRACDPDGSEFGPIELPIILKPVGPNVDDGTLLQSVSTALHVTTTPITGQTASKSSLIDNSGVFVNPEQPLMHSVNVTDDDIRRQEERVALARKKLIEALKD